MNKRICMIICLAAIMLVCLFTWAGKQENDARLVAWTETADAGTDYIKIYSTASDSVIETLPGSLIIGPDENSLYCYEKEEKNIALYSVSSRLVKEKICDIPLEEYSQIIAYLDHKLYYIDNTFLKCADASGKIQTMIKLKGAGQYQLFPQPSHDGKWAYFYLDNGEYYIDMIDAHGTVTATIKGTWPTWYDTNTLLFNKSHTAKKLTAYDYEAKTAYSFPGNTSNTAYSLFYTGGIFVDSKKKYLTYAGVQYQHFGPFELDYPQGLKIIMQDLRNGQRKKIQLPAESMQPLWIIANIPSAQQ